MSASTTKIARAWAIGLAVGLLAPPPALASTTRARLEPARTPAVEVRVEPVTLDAELDRARVEERAHAVLERQTARLEPGERIVVDLAVDGSGYRVIVRAFRNGSPLAEQPAPFDHHGSSDALLLRVEARIEGAIHRLAAAREPTLRKSDEAQARADETSKRRRFRLRIPGALATGLGASMLAGGALMTSYGVQPPRSDLRAPSDLRPHGVVLMGTGAALLVTGVSLLVVDGVRCRKHRAACSDTRPTLRPTTWLGPSWVAAST